jgi:hypothetical protein
MRICAEIREELEPEKCRWSGGHALAAPEPQAAPPGTAHCRRGLRELRRPWRPALWRPQRRAADRAPRLGDVPLIGFFAGGEIARHHLYGYTGVLTVFVGD